MDSLAQCLGQSSMPRERGKSFTGLHSLFSFGLLTGAGKTEHLTVISQR